MTSQPLKRNNRGFCDLLLEIVTTRGVKNYPKWLELVYGRALTIIKHYQTQMFGPLFNQGLYVNVLRLTGHDPVTGVVRISFSSTLIN